MDRAAIDAKRENIMWAFVVTSCLVALLGALAQAHGTPEGCGIAMGIIVALFVAYMQK